VEIFGRVNNKSSILDRLHIRRRSPIGLRIAPLVDMIFLLLIFFLVAAKWRAKEDFLPLQLATAGIGVQTAGKPEPLLIQISQTGDNCQVRIGTAYIVDIHSQKTEEGLAVMMEKTRQCLLEQKRYASDPVEIICASGVKWEYLAKIYNIFVGMGINDITFRMTGDSANAPAK